LELNDLLTISVRQVIRHRRRYLGVVLAIALGVAGFITIITMGREVKRNFNEDLDLIGGVTVIRIYFDNQRAYQPQWFRPQTLTALKKLPGVKDLSLAAVASGSTIRQGQRFTFMLMGVEDGFWQVRSFWADSGHLFGAEDVAKRRRECVLGTELARKIFGRCDITGEYLEINQEPYRISGVLGGVTDSSLANSALLPLTTTEDRLPTKVLPDRLYLRCNTWDDVNQVAAAIPATINRYQMPEQLHVEVMWEALKRVQHVAWWVEFFIYLAITATFFLGGIGIWNVMMAAVRSRTREIGLKKAMGAKDRDILAQFLSEALCLSIGAALLGATLGRIGMQVMGYLIGSHPQEDLFFLSLMMGLAFAIVLGVGAGLYPSIQASRMEVVSAIRYE
jgi:putative ABC transport system permease protein